MLTDEQCNAIYYARAKAIASGQQPGSGDGIARDRDLIRWAYRAGQVDALEKAVRACENIDERDRDFEGFHLDCIVSIEAIAKSLKD